ncbi:MAG TPA: hypothetical protein VNM47_06690 [Terriglobia bacterium]|nr:hypothetical protein [Terriglobia bacterium]
MPVSEGRRRAFNIRKSGWKIKKNTFFEKQSREVVDNKRSSQKNKPKRTQNEAGKLLKIHSCGKNEPKNEPGHVVENKRGLKFTLPTFRVVLLANLNVSHAACL